MSAPQILWLARALPLPLDAGDRMYTAFLAEALADAGADVRFVGLASPDAPDAKGEEALPSLSFTVVPGGPRSQIRALLSRHPLVSGRFGTAEYRRVLGELLAEQAWDAIVLDQYALVWALPLIEAKAKGRPVLIHVAHDFETQVTRDLARAYTGNPLRKAVLALNARRTARAERTLAAACDAVVTLTEEDREAFRAIGAKGAMAVIPPGYKGVRVTERAITSATPRRIAIVGSYQWIVKQHNLAAFLEVADARLAEAGIELAIVGGAPAEFRETWEQRCKAAKFHGYVDDLTAFLMDCRMGLVIEAVGGGFKLKVLDYVMTRTPLAGLSAGLTGQAKSVMDHCLVRDISSELCDAIIALIDDVDQLDAMQEGAYAAASAHYDWAENGRKLLALVTGRKT
ncbi:glycosyltransferase [Croceicoccus mobilis]|uniref:Glycosyltransferase subfamily 4-like N-terminal domain-containing protein n=1 Tax=Croceicoccus mobilis TaxID=1703339 RepID=A0A917DS67_9SPHN|nr:glycosyltransferase [Croceicoccus mobilis]GGD65954.1 hypothetical protein GCM10010990_14300 [Croceicoccus mobilis]